MTTSVEAESEIDCQLSVSVSEATASNTRSRAVINHDSRHTALTRSDLRPVSTSSSFPYNTQADNKVKILKIRSHHWYCGINFDPNHLWGVLG